MDDVVVVGGGAAGLIAAWRAASLGARTRVVEKNRRLGVKLRISGGGKCNITHSGPMEELRRAFQPPEARFLAGPFRRFTNQDVLGLLAEAGVATHARPDGRVFPDSNRADDVVAALEGRARSVGVSITLDVPVSGLIRNRNGIGGIEAGGALFPAHTTILAVGGSSYPKTGTTGDGFRWCRELGHTLVPLRAALAPLYLVPDDCRPEWSGVALRDCTVRARRSAPEGSVGKELARWRGDLLYTHQGVSGPAVLEISGPVASAMEQSGATVEADLVPDQPEEALHSLFAAAHATQGRKTVRAVAAAWVPERLLPALFERAALAPHITLHQLSRPARHRLVQAMKRWRIGAVRAVPLERGEVTAGGVSLDEVDPRTMASRRVNGLYLCGELLDIAGPVGGYNLQAAFSTGYVAGEAAAAATVRHDAGSG